MTGSASDASKQTQRPAGGSQSPREGGSQSPREGGSQSLREGGSQRLDKWLWFTRLVKTRSLATKMVNAGKVRVNRVKSDKPSQAIRSGDVITATVGKNVRVLEVVGIGARRGPAPEAQALYEDLAPIERASAKTRSDRATLRSGQREPGSGRPTKRDRRLLDRLRTTD